jgi:hypothetical protein
MEMPIKVKEAIAKLPANLQPFANASWEWLWIQGEKQFDAFIASTINTPVPADTFSGALAGLSIANDEQKANAVQRVADQKAVMQFIGEVFKAAMMSLLLSMNEE